MQRGWILAIFIAIAAGSSAGCAWTPEIVPDEAAPRPAHIAASLAGELIGTPYRWGGATPAGFDCSGLVYYTFAKAGVAVPRTSQAQFQAARPVPAGNAQPGDLVFFGQRGRITHVGIYVGEQRFIHAPETGRAVSIASLADDYYRRRFAGMGRID